MILTKFLEFNKQEIEEITPIIKSFYLKDQLNPEIWNKWKINKDIRKKLLKLAKDFYKLLELDAPIHDIILTGSLANYNYSKYSDFDVHIVIDYSDVNDDIELVEQLCEYAKKTWMFQYEIQIKGYDFEPYIQNGMETLQATGVFSLLKNKWIKKPELGNFKPDEKLINAKAKAIIEILDEIEDQYDNMKYSVVKAKIKRLWTRIKKLRKAGLEKGGEMSTGNLLFKLLRRSGDIGRIMNLKRKAYEKQFKEK